MTNKKRSRRRIYRRTEVAEGGQEMKVCQYCGGDYLAPAKASEVAKPSSASVVRKEPTKELSSTRDGTPSSPRAATIPVQIKSVKRTELLDSGPSINFIDARITRRLDYKRKKRISTSASAKILGSIRVYPRTRERMYTRVRMSIMNQLCPEIILEHAFMKKHSSVNLGMGGLRDELRDIEATIGKETVAVGAGEGLEKPRLFEFMTLDRIPIAYCSLEYTEEDSTFVDDEVSRVLNEGKTEPPRSTWRAQVVVARENRLSQLITPRPQIASLCRMHAISRDRGPFK